MHPSRYILATPLVLAAAITQEFMLPMSDNVTLHTLVDFPWVNADPNGGHNLTAVLDRSPYTEIGTEMIADLFSILGHVGVRQDVRGTGKSGGVFGLWHDSPGDGFDTVEWIIQQPWSNGVVYTSGLSADGLAAFGLAVSRPPAVRAQFYMFAGSSGWEIVYPGGAYRKGLFENWIEDTVPTNPQEAIAIAKQNEAPGSWWDDLNGTLFYPDVNWPTYQWAGWYDIFLNVQLESFTGLQTLSQAAGQQRIFIDPLGHCVEGSFDFPANTVLGRALAAVYLALDLLAAGNSSTTSEGLDRVTFYVMGSQNDSSAPGNYWTTLPSFPAFQPQAFYLTSARGLNTTKPGSQGGTTYHYDPANPVPTIGGNNLFESCGPLDQSSVEAPFRQDVLTYTSLPLTAPLAVTGPLVMQLFVSSTRPDTDFTVKLTDVHPDGTSTLIQDGIVRMRWRNAPRQTSEPQLIVPDVIYPVNVSLWNTSFIWAAGHSIRVDISSSNYPRFEPNPNNGLPITANGTIYTANNTVWFGGEYASALILPVVDAATQLPPVQLTEVMSSSIEQRLHSEFGHLGDGVLNDKTAEFRDVVNHALASGVVTTKRTGRQSGN